MSKGMDDLQTLLSGNGRELVNVKFFPGTGRGLSDGQMAEAACDLLRVDFDNLVDNPPVSGVSAASL